MRSTVLILLAAGTLGACTQLIRSDDASFATDPITPSNGSVLELVGAQQDDNFGTAVALEGDELIVAAPNATLRRTRSTAQGACGDVIDAPNAGRVVVFDREDEGWVQTDELSRTYVQQGEGTVHFSKELSLPLISVARAGDLVAVGVPGAGFTLCDGVAERAAQAGKVYVYRRENDRWKVEEIRSNSPPFPNTFFGAAVALGDGELFVGAPGADDLAYAPPFGDDAPTDNGVVFVFARVGDSWQETQRIVPMNRIDGAQFGNALSVQGDTLAIGAWADSHSDRGIHSSQEVAGAAATDGAEPVEYSGAVYIFRKREDRWEEETYFKAFNRGFGAGFGTAVALDGNFLIVGAPGESSVHATADAEEIASGAIEASATTVIPPGAVYVYQRAEHDWTAFAYLKAFDPTTTQLFGASVAAHSGSILAGAPFESLADPEGGPPVALVGAAYLYRREGHTFTPVAALHHPMVSPGLNVGYTVALSDRYAVVGAGSDDVGPGSVSVFDLQE